MLNNIKSHYFLEKIFSIINNKRKFKLVKYNKILQNKLDIAIMDYKIMSSKYIEYEQMELEKNMIQMIY